MTALTTVSAAELRSDESARFWALICYLGEHPDATLDERLTAIRLAYFYDAEVLNGGHLQYFQNRGTAEAPTVVKALEVVGAVERAVLLQEAMEIMASSPFQPSQIVGGVR